MKLKLLVDNKSSKVLFAEAEKEFVDFLFSLLALPLGTVTRLLKQNDDMVGSLGVLYKSIEGLCVSYIQPDLSMEAVLCPKVALPLVEQNVPLLKCEGVAYAQKKFFRCSNCKSSKLSYNPQTRCPSCSYVAMSTELAFLNPSAAPDYDDTELYVCRHCNSKYVTENPDTRCPSCRHLMNAEVTYLNPSSAATEKGGYVKGVVTYMVMDDLDVKPMSTISSISLLNTFNIKDVGVLVEMTVSIGMAEGLKLLRASLCSKTVLTDVFLRKTDA
ncbi:unnamed protein product [Rhodiola kirilowii]